MTEAQDSKALSQARYTRFADGYITSETHAKGSDLDRLIDIAKPERRWNALDVATGGGHTALKFAPFVAHVIASDLTLRMLESARRHIVDDKGVANVSFQEADAEDLPFEANSFDLVTCRIAPHHFPDAQRFLRECARVLRPGAILILQDQLLPDDAAAAQFVDAFERLRDPSHNRAFNEAEWTAMCAAAGLAVEHSEHYIKRHQLLPWARRQGNDEVTIGQLVQMMREAPPLGWAWMDPIDWGRESATFVNRHIIIRARAK